jgi:hypothetical protein
VSRRLPAAALSLVLAGLSLVGCAEVEETTPAGYEPSHVEPVKGSDLKTVTFTAEGARRTGLKTATVERSDGTRVVPYASLIYDGEGQSYVYTSPKPLTYVRAPVVVDRIDGRRALLKRGPPAESEVVTVGASEVYGAELEIAGSH